MDLALKDLRKAAEQEMGGIQAGGISTANLNELKQVISKTTKVTKVGRGEAGEKAEDVTQEVPMQDESDDGEDNEGSMDIVMDTDGNQKRKSTKYDAEDDLMSEAGS
mmetsp:Transcript_28505/g.38019  ORF Transcript_28505/g.38019 Transcript_28505/m.38019 type:complete len:107 (+) Transcript_28505:494-814(+)